MSALRELHKEKGRKVWKEEYKCEVWEEIPLKESIKMTYKRVIKQAKKQYKKEKDNSDREDALYKIGNEGGLFYLETDIILVLWDVHQKITHIPSKEKIKAKIQLLTGDSNNDPNEWFVRENHSLLESLAIGVAGFDMNDNKINIINQKIYQMNDAPVKETMDFCINEYKKAIKFIIKLMNENSIKCEIIGDCYLDT